MIGSGTTVRGTISGDEDLAVHGRVEGVVRLSKDLTVAEGAVVAADVEARAIAVSGTLEGEVHASTSLVVEAGAVVVGNVRTPRLVIADGAKFKGRVDMDFEIEGAPASAPAPAAEPPARRR